MNIVKPLQYFGILIRNPDQFLCHIRNVLLINFHTRHFRKEIIFCSNSCFVLFCFVYVALGHCLPCLSLHFLLSLGVLLSSPVLSPQWRLEQETDNLVIQFLRFQIKRSHMQISCRVPCEPFLSEVTTPHQRHQRLNFIP